MSVPANLLMIAWRGTPALDSMYLEQKVTMKKVVYRKILGSAPTQRNHARRIEWKSKSGSINIHKTSNGHYLTSIRSEKILMIKK